MNNKNEMPRVRFSAAKFKRLPMPEKLAYLRAAFSALGNGLQVLERRRSAPRTLAPAGESLRPEILSRAQFEQLSLEEKRTYLSGAFRELEQAQRRVRDLPGERSAKPLPETSAK